MCASFNAAKLQRGKYIGRRTRGKKKIALHRAHDPTVAQTHAKICNVCAIQRVISIALQNGTLPLSILKCDMPNRETNVVCGADEYKRAD
jgi:hypothetical protein